MAEKREEKRLSKESHSHAHTMQMTMITNNAARKQVHTSRKAKHIREMSRQTNEKSLGRLAGHEAMEEARTLREKI